MTNQQTFTHQPKGVTVALQDLQRLRFLSQSFNHSQKKSQALLSGGHRGRQQNRGMEFEEVRLYQVGDDVRSIDWRVTARTQTPHTKCFQEEKEKPVITVVDQRVSLFFGSQHCFKSVYACQLSALINWATLNKGDRSGGLVIGTQANQYCRPTRSQRAINRWLQQLVEYNQQLLILQKRQQLHQSHQPSFKEILSQLKNTAPSGSEIILISDFYDLDFECEKRLFSLSKQHQLRFYWLIDPLEMQLPLTEQITLSNGEHENTLAITNTIQQKHQRGFLNKAVAIDELCRHLQIELLPISTNTPLLDIYQKHSIMRERIYGTAS